jgi:hypothetical protein
MAMIADEERDTGAKGMPLELVWRNTLSDVRAHLTLREKSDPYCRWAEQASKIRARRGNWDANHTWAE